MADQVTVSFGPRRVLGWLLLAFACCLAFIIVYILHVARLNAGIYTGLLLYLVVLALASFNSRKKVPFLPLLRASTWLQLHIYVGLFSCLLFFLHIGWRWPNGIFEGVLAAVFAIVALSGVLGLFISRILPPRMTESGESLIYERIPRHREKLTGEIEALALKAETEAESSVLSDLYFKRLQPFMDRVPGVFLCLASSDQAFLRVRQEIDASRRYVNEQEATILNEVAEVIEAKRNLDLQFSAMHLLRLWLFVHIPFTVSLLILGFAHGLLALWLGARP
ncbi:MAG: hypothetical protein ACFB21_07855 [Opitutales bacterium]